MPITPGRYTFRVLAANNDGKWNEIGSSIDFRIAAAFSAQRERLGPARSQFTTTAHRASPEESSGSTVRMSAMALEKVDERANRRTELTLTWIVN
jgi:hypothetical protein